MAVDAFPFVEVERALSPLLVSTCLLYSTPVSSEFSLSEHSVDVASFVLSRFGLNIFMSVSSLSLSLSWGLFAEGRGAGLLFILRSLEARGRVAVLTVSSRPIAYYFRVNGAGHAVLHLRVHFGKDVERVVGGLVDVTDCGRLHDTADRRLLDGLVFGAAASAVGTADEGGASATVLRTAIISSLRCHDRTKQRMAQNNNEDIINIYILDNKTNYK